MKNLQSWKILKKISKYNCKNSMPDTFKKTEDPLLQSLDTKRCEINL